MFDDEDVHEDTLMERSLLSFLDNDWFARVGTNIYTQFFFRRQTRSAPLFNQANITHFIFFLLFFRGSSKKFTIFV